MTGSAHLTFFHTSDEHGHIRNAPTIQHAVASARAENPEGTLLVSTGDVFEGSATSTLLGAQPAVDVLKAAGYNVMALGNHDFDKGEEFARKWIAEAPCPVLAANIEEADGGQMKGTQPSRIVEANGVKVGLIGVTTPDTPKLIFGEGLPGLRFTDPQEAVRREAEALRAQGVGVIGVLSHLGLAVDRQLAQAVPGLDFIIGGHTHNETLQGEVVNGTMIGHPGSFRNGVGRLDLSVDQATGRVSSVRYNLLKVDPDATERDAAVDAIVQVYEDRMKAFLQQPVAFLDKGLTHDDLQRDELEALVTGAMMKASQADIAFITQKFTRASMPAGVITRKDTLNIMPFDNRLQALTLPATEVARILAESARRNDATTMAVSGLSHEDGRLKRADGTFVADDAEVKVGTTDYILSGGLGYLLKDLRSVGVDHGPVRDIVERELTEASKDHPSYLAAMTAYNTRMATPTV